MMMMIKEIIFFFIYSAITLMLLPTGSFHVSGLDPFPTISLQPRLSDSQHKHTEVVPPKLTISQWEKQTARGNGLQGI